MKDELAVLEAAVRLIKNHLDHDVEFSSAELYRIGSCAGTLRSYLEIGRASCRERVYSSV